MEINSQGVMFGKFLVSEDKIARLQPFIVQPKRFAH